MSHSHDKTMLAKFGFSDPDLRLPRHDMACRFVSIYHAGVRDAAMGVTRNPGWRIGKYTNVWVEYPIEKGAGQYKTTIGFADVFASLSFEKVNEDGAKDFINADVLFEVKITPVTASEVIRQLNLYRSYKKPKSTVLVVDFDYDASSVDMLKQEDISVIKLGNRFDKWVKHEEERAVPSLPTL